MHLQRAVLLCGLAVAVVVAGWAIYRQAPRDKNTVTELHAQHSVGSTPSHEHLRDERTLRLLLVVLSGILIVLVFQTLRLFKQRARANQACRRAEESQQRFDAFLQRAPTPAFMRDEDGLLIYANDAYARATGRSASELIGCDGFAFWPPAVREQLRFEDTKVLKEGLCTESNEKIVAPTGHTELLSLKFPVYQQGRRLVGGISLDITESRKLEEIMRFTQFAVDRSPDLILWVNSSLRIIYANQAACATLGYTADELKTMRIGEIDPGQTSDCLLARVKGEHLKSSLTFESFHFTRSGSMLPVEVSVNYLEFDGKEFGCCISRNISERRRAEQELAYQAQHDHLTGLPNRRLLEMRLDQELANARKSGDMVAVLFLDLDGFKLINDTLGHASGDELLRALGKRIDGYLEPQDMLARMGGDEFAIVLSGLEQDARALELADGLQSRLTESFHLNGQDLTVTTSVGISMFPRDGEDSNTLLKSADAAMYESKRRGKNLAQFFTPQMSDAARERLELENLLRRALERNEFLLYFQPQLGLATNRIERYEALLRWNQPTLGMIQPSKFIPVAEEMHLVESIGKWVLEEACRQMRGMHNATGSEIGVAVNVSALQFLRIDFVPNVLEILKRTGLAPHLLELEITESVVMASIEDVTEKIHLLRAAGIGVSIDDFGTGYSSLGYLQQLPIDILKIDRSFLRRVPEDESAIAMLDAVVNLAHSLQMKVVLEGVETIQQLNVARRMKIDYVQGFYIARPAPLGSYVQMTQNLTALTGALSEIPEMVC